MAKDILKLSVVEDGGEYTITVSGEKAEKVVKAMMGGGCCCCTPVECKDDKCCEEK